MLHFMLNKYMSTKHFSLDSHQPRSRTAELVLTHVLMSELVQNWVTSLNRIRELV